MKCKECGASLQGRGGLVLECKMCALYPADCDCKSQRGRLPDRLATCQECDRIHCAGVNTQNSDWRGLEV
jgi:hypothetical protein